MYVRNNFIHCQLNNIYLFINEALDLPDTFQSWFLVAHLHLWLCLVRLKREGQDGDVIIKELVTMFWEDARQKMNKIGVSMILFFCLYICLFYKLQVV